jgi:hypothetical protein
LEQEISPSWTITSLIQNDNVIFYADLDALKLVNK